MSGDGGHERSGRVAARRRFALALRIFAATAGSYALAAAAAAALARWLPLARAEATLAATLASFAMLPAGAIWAFAAARARTGLGGLMVAVALLLIAAWIAGPPR